MYTCIIVSHGVHIVVHTKDTLHNRLCYFTLPAASFSFSSLCNPQDKVTQHFIACMTTCVTSYTYRGPGVKVHMQTVSHFVCESLALQN